MPTGFHRIAAAMVAVAVATTSCSRLAQAQSAPAWAYPIGTRTGVPAVDAALRAIEAGDTAAFEALFVLHPPPVRSPAPGRSRALPANRSARRWKSSRYRNARGPASSEATLS